MSDTAVLSKAWPMVASDGILGLDNDRDFRLMMSAMMSPDVVTGDAMAARAGVLPHQWDTDQSVTTLRVQQQTSASMHVDVLGGPFVCVRDGQGPYIGWSEDLVTLDVDTAPTSNPRQDLVYAWVGDMVNFDGVDTVHGPIAGIITGDTGNPAPAPRFDLLPDGAVALATVDVGVNVHSIVKADIHLIRKGTCLSGGTRRLLEGDNVTDPGRVDGEQRYRQGVGTLPALLDYWDAVQQKWRGTQTITYTAPFPGTTGHTSGSARLTVITFNIPDPGWPYRVKTSTVLRLQNAPANVYASVNNALFSSAIQTFLVGDPGGPFPMVPGDSGIVNGASIVRLNIDPLSPFNVVTWSTDSRNKLLIEVVPQ